MRCNSCSETASHDVRKPAAFRLDDPHVIVADDDDARRARHRARRAASRRHFDLPVPVARAAPAKRSFRWGTVFWSALGGLVALGIGLATTRLIEDLYARAQWLGTIGAVLAAHRAARAARHLRARDRRALPPRLDREAARPRRAAALLSDDRDEARAIVRALTAKLSATPALARAARELDAHLTEIIDGRDLLHIAERHLMAPLDQRSLSAGRAHRDPRLGRHRGQPARRASTSPSSLIAALGMIRRLAALYGGRPGMLGLIRLVRHIVAHLAVTGGIAAGDSLIQQVLGHGVAAKLSARLGEGVLNGLLTARLGLAAIEVARPLPFAALPKPKLSDIAGDLLRRRRGSPGEKAPERLIARARRPTLWHNATVFGLRALWEELAMFQKILVPVDLADPEFVKPALDDRRRAREGIGRRGPARSMSFR